MMCKEGVLKDFPKFTGQDPVTLTKKDTPAAVSSWES